MKKALRMLLVLPLLVALMAGCSKPPEMQIAAADQAMQAAQATQASKYAAADWQMANDTLQAAKAEKAAQDSRFALFRSYGKSQAMFEKASALMNTASTNAKAEMERVRKETEAMLNMVRTELDSTATMVANAPAGKDTKAELELMKQDLTALQQMLSEAQAEWSRNNFDGAKNKAQTIRDRMNTMRTQLEAAMAKRGGKKR
jgi:hypothetical protein